MRRLASGSELPITDHKIGGLPRSLGVAFYVLFGTVGEDRD